MLSRRRAGGSRPETQEREDIAVGIGHLEAPKPLVDERQPLDERRTAPRELVEERVGIERMDVGVPAGLLVPSVVRLRQHVRRDRLQHDADAVSAHAAVVGVVVRPLEVELKPEALDVVRDRGA